MSTRRVRVPDTDITTPRRELVLGVLVLLLVLVIGYLSTTALSGSPFSSQYEVRVPLPADGPIVRDGDPVRVAGQRAGQVRRVTVAADGRTAVATLTLSRGKVGPGAAARVRLKGLAGATYLDLDRGDTRRPLPSGATLAPTRVHGAAQLSDVVAAFDRQTRGALARTVSATGTALGGRGTELNGTLAALPAALRRTTPLLRGLVPATGTLTALVDAAGRVASAAAPAGSTELRGLLPAARAVLQSTGAGARDLEATLAALPAAQRQVARTLPRADALLSDVRTAAVRLQPGIRALRAALPAVLRVEGRDAGLDRLAALARTATPVVRDTVPVLQQLRGSALALSAVATPVAKLSTDLVPYRRELVEAPAGFTRWGDFVYQDGQAKGHRAVRFSMVFTCAHHRDPYPAAGAAADDRKACR